MDSSQRALQTNEKLFSNSFSNYWPKAEKYSNPAELDLCMRGGGVISNTGAFI